MTTDSTGDDPHRDNIDIDFNTINGEGIVFAEDFET